MDTNELKKIAERFTADRIEACLRQQLTSGTNECEPPDESDDIVATLSKAEVVRELMDQGMTFSEALRELARRIRAVYGKEKEG